MNSIQQVGLKISREQRLYFSYPDPVSAEVERRYYTTSRKIPMNFTGYLNRKERLEQEAKEQTWKSAT